MRSRRNQRPRRYVRPTTLRLARVFGFRHDPTRNAYVLRLVGNRTGPVLRSEDSPDAAAAAIGWSPQPDAERRTRDRRQTVQRVPHERRSGRDRRAPLTA